VRQLEQRQTELEQRLARAVVIVEEKQAELTSVARARGVTLRDCQELLELLIPGQVLSVASLGGRSQAAAAKAGQLLKVLDELTRERVHESAADEIYVKDPVLMVVEPESLCWISGRRSDQVTGEAWARELAVLPHLEQVTRDGGAGMEKGVALVNAERQARGQTLLVDQGDHFHALRGGSLGLNKAQRQASQALAEAEAAQEELDACARQGQARTLGCGSCQLRLEESGTSHGHLAGEGTAPAPDQGGLATGHADRGVEYPAASPGGARPDVTAVARQRFREDQKPEMLHYLDRAQQKITALPFPEEVKQPPCVRRLAPPAGSSPG
jgi:hypothetical protein